MAGIEPAQIHEDIGRVAVGMGDKEISAAISKAAMDHGANGLGYRPPPRPEPIIKSGKTALKRIISQGTISDDLGLLEVSPVSLLDPPEEDPIILLTVLFKTDELIFIGDRLEVGVIGKNIRSAADWISFFKAGGKAGPFIIINTFTGKAAPKKSGDGDSYRCDGAVKTFRHCLVEFDNLSRDDQIRFWSAARLPILALIDSGGKSVHVWLDVQKLSNVSNEDQWTKEIKNGLYEKGLIPLGVDRACCNPSRLSRLPGYFRAENRKFQRLLWLSPEGREVTE